MRPPFPLGPSEGSELTPIPSAWGMCLSREPPSLHSHLMVGSECISGSGVGHMVTSVWAGRCQEKGIWRSLSPAGMRSLSYILLAGLTLTAPHVGCPSPGSPAWPFLCPARPQPAEGLLVAGAASLSFPPEPPDGPVPQPLPGGLPPMGPADVGQEKARVVPLQSPRGVPGRVGRVLSPAKASHGGCVGSRPSLATDLSCVCPQDLREKNWKAMEALASAERTCEEKLRSLTQAKVRVLHTQTHLLVQTWSAAALWFSKPRKLHAE